jgi:hypothetical protein
MTRIMTQQQREAFALRNYSLSRINEAPFAWCHIPYVPDSIAAINIAKDYSYRRCWIVGSSLFEPNSDGNSFADAYDLFAVNYANILLGYVYYPNTGILPPSADVSIKMASSVGTVIGQISFGILIDLYGRKKVLDAVSLNSDE